MVAKISVSIDDDLGADVDAPLEYGDTRSRRVNELLRVALAVERELIETGGIHQFATAENRIWVGAALDHAELVAFAREAVAREAERRARGPEDADG